MEGKRKQGGKWSEGEGKGIITIVRGSYWIQKALKNWKPRAIILRRPWSRVNFINLDKRE